MKHSVCISGRLFYTQILMMICLASVIFYGCDNTNPEEELLVIASYGGDWQQVQQQTMFQPFADEFGVEVNDIEYDGQYSSLTSSEAMDWDIVAVEKNMVSIGARDGILEPINYSIVDSSNLNPDAIHEYGVGIMAWSWVLAYHTEIFSGEAPSSWEDFFNIEEFPGSRGLRDDPRRVLEIALLADGVNESGLYPLDVDRAVQKLENFHQDLLENGYELIWWDHYADPIDLLVDDQVVMTPATNGRIFTAKQDNDLPINFTWEHGIVDFDWWVVLKDSSSKEEAMSFINYASSAEAQSKMAAGITYGPVNEEALNSIDEGIKHLLPTDPVNLEKQILFNNEWWSENYESVLPEWNDWFGKLKVQKN